MAMMVDCYLDRVFCITNYEHGENEVEKVVKCFAEIEHYLYHLGYLDDVNQKVVPIVIQELASRYCKSRD